MFFSLRNPIYLLIVLMIMQGCNGDEDTTNSNNPPTNATPAVTTINRGPTKFSVAGDPNGLYGKNSLNADNRRLFLSDHDPNEDVKAAVHYLQIIPVD